MISVIVHVVNEEPIACEVEALPQPQDTLLFVHNPRRRDGMEIHYLDEDVNHVIYPIHRINFIQILPSADIGEVFSFVRE